MKMKVLDHELAAAVHLPLVDSDKSFYHTPFHHKCCTSYATFDDLPCDSASFLADLAAAVQLVGEYVY
jgi:hypothetical protein